jgi:hypothetical protein
MFPVPRPPYRCGNLFRDIRCRNHILCKRNPVIGKKMHFEQTLCIRIVIDDTGHIVYEFYYELCHVIAGRSFTRKKDRTWYDIFLSVLYSLVKSNTVQRLEQLPLVFVNSLYMNIKHHVRADFHPFPFTDFVYKFLFADLLGLHPLLLKFRIVGILFQTFELIEPGNPSRSILLQIRSLSDGLDL